MVEEKVVKSVGASCCKYGRCGLVEGVMVVDVNVEAGLVGCCVACRRSVGCGVLMASAGVD